MCIRDRNQALHIKITVSKQGNMFEWNAVLFYSVVCLSVACLICENVLFRWERSNQCWTKDTWALWRSCSLSCHSVTNIHLSPLVNVILILTSSVLVIAPLPPIDTIWAMMIVWRTRGDYRTARAVLEAIIAFSAMHTYYEQLLQVKQICLCLTRFTSLCLDAYVFLCSLVFHCMHVVLL